MILRFKKRRFYYFTYYSFFHLEQKIENKITEFYGVSQSKDTSLCPLSTLNKPQTLPRKKFRRVQIFYNFIGFQYLKGLDHP